MAVSRELLRGFNLLAPLPEAALQQLAGQAQLRRFERRELVIAAGREVTALCFLFEGRLQGVDFTLDGREVGLYFVEPGDFCGELGLFDASGQPESVIALVRAQVVLLPAAALRAALEGNAELTAALFNRLAGRVRDLSAQRALLSLPGTTSRVCAQLWRLLEESRAAGLGDEIRHPPTHQEIAIMLNLSRESVTRVFQKLQARKLVRRDGPGCLKICDPAALEELARGN